MQLWHGAYHSLDYYWILRHNSGLYLSPLDAYDVKLGLDVENQIKSTAIFLHCRSSASDTCSTDIIVIRLLSLQAVNGKITLLDSLGLISNIQASVSAYVKGEK